ncbi:hypothetical protein [Pedobacter sp.]|uniref:hypothetical protein n=1 Tax=Pedobacter sp. TaxID=1411316 RepID=UPI003BAB019B
MPYSKKKSLMIFKIRPEKFLELSTFVDCDTESLTVLSTANNISSGAVFQDISSLEAMFEEFENAS